MVASGAAARLLAVCSGILPPAMPCYGASWSGQVIPVQSPKQVFLRLLYDQVGGGLIYFSELVQYSIHIPRELVSRYVCPDKVVHTRGGDYYSIRETFSRSNK